MFSQQSESFNISKLQKKDMSQLSRRDLSRMEEASEVNSGGESRIGGEDNTQSKMGKISCVRGPQKSQD